MPDVPLPDDLPDAETILKDLIESNTLNEEQTKFIRFRIQNVPESFITRPVNRAAWERLRPTPPKYAVWMKLKERIEDTPTTHHCIAAYISDSAMVSTGLLPHLKEGENMYTKVLMFSLDHSIWIHRPDFRVDEWLLYELESTVADNNRAMILGKMWTLDGRHVMSTAQEGLIRPLTK
uniref:Acyl-CoA thioesterase 8 n=1 Tax=Plectus sambesii TaxID=2011161 RepID=A0A914WRA0_9BILA